MEIIAFERSLFIIKRQYNREVKDTSGTFIRIDRKQSDNTMTEKEKDLQTIDKQ